MPEYLTRRQAADRAGVGIRTIDRWLREPGKLTTYRTVGRETIRISQEELDALTAVVPDDPEADHEHDMQPAEDDPHADLTCSVCGMRQMVNHRHAYWSNGEWPSW